MKEIKIVLKDNRIYKLKIPECKAEGTLSLKDDVIVLLYSKLHPEEFEVKIVLPPVIPEIIKVDPGRQMWHQGNRVGAALQVKEVLNVNMSDALTYCELNFY